VGNYKEIIDNLMRQEETLRV